MPRPRSRCHWAGMAADGNDVCFVVGSLPRLEALPLHVGEGGSCVNVCVTLAQLHVQMRSLQVCFTLRCRGWVQAQAQTRRALRTGCEDLGPRDGVV